MLKLLLMSFLFSVKAYDICVVGGTSGLGKEIIYQGILDKNKKILALSGSSSPITVPYRSNSFENKQKKQQIFDHPNLKTDNYWTNVFDYNYDHIIFSTGCQPFEKDYSDELMCKLLMQLPKSCKSITLISAFGVGESIKESNLGITIMNNWYLKDAYRAKNEQEKILNNYKYPIIKKIFRPKALSYGNTTLESISRQKLAQTILEEINDIN